MREQQASCCSSVLGDLCRLRLLRTENHEQRAVDLHVQHRLWPRSDVAQGRVDAAVVAIAFESVLPDANLREFALGDYVVALVRHDEKQIRVAGRCRRRTLRDPRAPAPSPTSERSHHCERSSRRRVARPRSYRCGW